MESYLGQVLSYLENIYQRGSQEKSITEKEK